MVIHFIKILRLVWSKVLCLQKAKVLTAVTLALILTASITVIASRDYIMDFSDSLGDSK